MENYLLAFLGIGVSVGLFMIGYRQTIGAKRERSNSANADLENIVIRRIFVEAYTPDVNDLSRLIEGKAREFRLKPGDMLSEAQLLTDVFTRIVDSDFIGPEQRQATLKRLEPVLHQATTSLLEEEEGVATQEYPPTRRRNRSLVIIMGVFASLAGALVATFSVAQGTGANLSDLIPFLVATMGLSLGIIAGSTAYLRLRDFQLEQPSKQNALDRSAEFEKEVASSLKSLHLTYDHIVGPYAGDYLITHTGKRSILEVRAWTTRPPAIIVRKLIDSLNQSLRRLDATEAIIVTPMPLRYALPPSAAAKHVTAMTLRQLRARFSDAKESPV